MGRICCFINTPRIRRAGLFKNCCGYAVGGDGHCLPVVSVIGELQTSLAVCCIELESVSAVDAVEGYGALLVVIDYYDDHFSLWSEICGDVRAESEKAFEIFLVSCFAVEKYLFTAF